MAAGTSHEPHEERDGETGRDRRGQFIRRREEKGEKFPKEGIRCVWYGWGHVIAWAAWAATNVRMDRPLHYKHLPKKKALLVPLT